MWLDRFASQANLGSATSSQPPSRPYSPLPRRSSNSLTPYVTSRGSGNTPKGSALSLVSSDSSVSLLASTRRTNGSALRTSTTPGEQPVDILEKLLDDDDERPDSAPTPPLCSITEADINGDFDFMGLSLSELASTTTKEDAPARRRGDEPTEDYKREMEKLEALHKSISSCDDILNSVEASLASFRGDLAVVSADIETLQTRSNALNIRLENRKAVEKALGPVVEELSVSPFIVSKIAEGQIDDTWVKTLAEVDKRVATYRKDTGAQGQSKAWADLGPLLEKLAVERIRDFMVAQVKSLRSPNINAQIIQQQNFVRFKDAFTFLHKHHPTLGDELCQAYLNTMRWYYLNLFTRYQKALETIKLHVVDKHDALGYEDSSRKGGLLSGSHPSAPPHDAFNLGRREDLLKTMDHAALPSYLAEEDQTYRYIEVPFRNLNLALVDNATAEYTFLATFFSPAMPLSRISKHFAYIFEPLFNLGQSFTKSLTGDSFDCLGLLLCIRLNQHFAFELQRRKVPTMDGYINGTNMLLWPRLQVVVDQHCESVRQLTNATPAKPPRASDAAKLSAAPHLVTQRFGQLLQGVLVLSREAGDDEPIVSSLRRLRSEVEAFLTRQSKLYGDRRKQERFLYNNYSLVSTIISDVEGKFAGEQQEHFETLKAAFREGA